MATLEERIKRQARELGFDPVGVARAGPADGFAHFREWLDAGHAGEMAYLHRHAEAHRHPSSVLPEVRSVVMVGMGYKPPEEHPAADGLRGRVARYARGQDYHEVMRERLDRLLAKVREEVPDCRGRGVVDTAPLLERDFARRAGLGWFGKNTMLLNRRLGSYLFLGALLLDLDLAPDPPHETSYCGTCTACLDACPTEAFPAPYQLDARRCISYLTIELRGPIPEELRRGVGDWVFGCDICQEVCPWNRKAPAGSEPAFHSGGASDWLNPVELLGMTEEDFRARFRGTALTRSKRRGLLRNAAVVLGNIGGAAALPALRRAMSDADEIVRDAAAWAVARIECRERK